MFKLRLTLLAMVLCVAVPVSAQPLAFPPIPIQGHPEKAAYNSPAECLTVETQGQWNPAQKVVLPGNPDGVLGHFHLHRCIYEDGEFSGPIRINFVAVIFATSGHLVGLTGNHMRDVVWDETGTSTMPATAIGDPLGVVTKTGHYTFDPTMDSTNGRDTNNFLYGAPKHGWALETAVLTGQYDNGDFQTVTKQSRYWSMLDPSAPLTAFSGDGAVTLKTAIFMNIPRDKAKGGDAVSAESPFGACNIDFRNSIPLGPIDHDLVGLFPSSNYNYGGDTSGELGVSALAGFADVRWDPDLHHGNPGTPAGGFFIRGLTAGAHRLAFTWTSTSGPTGTSRVTSNETLGCVLVVPVTVAPTLVPNPPMAPFDDSRVLSVAIAGMPPGVPVTLQPGQLFSADVVVLNTSSVTWTSAGRYFLRTANGRNNTRYGDFFWANPVPGTVPPGQRVTFHIEATAPSTPGFSSFAWRMEHEGVTSEMGSVGQTMLVVSGSAPPPPPITCQLPGATNIGGPLPCVFPPPPAPTCQEAGATNIGGPLPCVFHPPPQPPPSWQTITGFLQRLNDAIRICDPADGKCAVVGTLVP